MSFIITLNVREGIVMASDSRLTLDRTIPGPPATVQLSVAQSDSNYKTFLVPSGVGISTFGAAMLNGEPLSGSIESFINDVAIPKKLSVEAAAQELLVYYSAMPSPPATFFHVAGYTTTKPPEPQVWIVAIADKKVERSNPSGVPGAWWGGQTDILARLIQNVAQLDGNGQIVEVLPYHQIPWEFLTLQDAVDFATFAVRSTIDATRFQPRPKTVGGPIDVLVIKPTGPVWIQRKELHVL
jgi:hypothetical protein